ncbi:hypothetical protein FIBSPDRAFT_1017748 [Athelia psychrophila]|uniref:Integrase core domain-containing protein n=1 Tax=Athelia psychrophila TaxID=1759441 RepID=A0A166L1I0_9AGAM|nr:hypothetical protein FIBSPDRAFT_1017748 [Fibularhizoctonia sp. CBS 109695]
MPPIMVSKGKKRASSPAPSSHESDGSLHDRSTDLDSESESSGAEDTTAEATGDTSTSVHHTRNPTGRNQWARICESPSTPSIAIELLRELNRRNIIGYKDIMEELYKRGFNVGRSKLAVYLKQTGIGSSRKHLIPRDIADQLVLDEMSTDPMMSRGPRDIKEALSLRGQHIPRPQVEAVMRAFAPAGFEQRKPSAKKMKRSALVSLGPNAEWSLDGHDKLMDAGFGIYGIRDKWSGKLLYYVVMPSNRYAAAVGVVYLRCVRKCGGISYQTASDRGSEIRDAYAFQIALRELFAPDLDVNLIPPWIFLSSPRNITIERGWRPLFEKWGMNILFFFNQGALGGFYKPNDYLHKQTSNWIWFPLVQSDLNIWVARQNAHRIRRQSAKLLPSGGRPDHFYENPQLYGGEPCLIPVDTEIIDGLLDQCDEGMEKL